MNIDDYLLRLLDECRDEINRSDSKASILLAAVAAGMAFVGSSLLNESGVIWIADDVAAVLSLLAAVLLVLSMALLGLAIIPRVGQPAKGRARYFEEHAQFASSQSLLDAVSAEALGASERHAQQLLALSKISRTKYLLLRRAIYSAGLGLILLCGAAARIAVA